MNRDAFIQENENHWKTLTLLLDRSKKEGIKAFSADEIHQLGSLYRKTCSDLSYARSKKYDLEIIRYLNHLAGRAYGVIYLRDKDRRGRFLKFFTHDFPRLVRENFQYILAAMVIFVVTTVVGYVWDTVDPAFSKAVVPQQFLQIWSKAAQEDRQNRQEYAAAFPLMSSWYLTHNFQVGMQSFVMGIFAGLGTLSVLCSNGLTTGAIISIVLREGIHIPFFSFVSSHAFIELMAIFICCGAGFMVGRALIAPGDFYRKDALYEYGKPAVRLVLGSIPMFFLAGVIEASFSRFNLPLQIKVTFGLLTVILMIIYFTSDPDKKVKRKKYPITPQ